MLNILYKYIIHLKHLLYESDRSIWYERQLSDEIPNLLLDASIKVSFNNVDKTFVWLGTLNSSWILAYNKIELASNRDYYISNIQVNDTIIGYGRLGINRVYIPDYGETIVLPKDTALSCHVYILEEFRNKGFAEKLLLEEMRLLRNEGYKKVGGQVSSWNRPSIALCTKLGFKEVCHIAYYKLFGVIKVWIFCKYDDGKHKVHFRIPIIYN